MFLTLYVLALAALAVHAPATVWQPGMREFVIVLAVLGAWHCGWGAVHLTRALIYRHLVFPVWRRAADRLEAAGLASELYIVITSHRIAGETTARVYQAAIAEAIRYGQPATIVAALVELGDQRLIQRLFRQSCPPPAVRLMLVRRPDLGHHGLACALRAICRARPAADAAVVVLHGDTLLTPGSLAASLPFLHLLPDVDSITTDQGCLLAAGPLMHAWHELRSARRHQLMSSIGLGRRWPAIAGRMMIWRGRVATAPSFIDALESDHLDHGRLGRISRPTADGGAAWLWLLRGDRAMLYVPNVRVVAIKQGSAEGLLPAATRRMLRRFADRLLIDAHALALGPGRLGRCLWWHLIEQRISMWTALAGPLAALSLALGKSIVFLYVYVLWAGATRLVEALALLTARPRISGLYPLLIEFDQVYGALVQTYALFHPDRQRSPGRTRLRQLGSAYLHLLALGALVAAAAFATDLLGPPGAGGTSF